MKTKTSIYIGIGLIVAFGIGLYVYKQRKKKAQVLTTNGMAGQMAAEKAKAETVGNPAYSASTINAMI